MTALHRLDPTPVRARLVGAGAGTFGVDEFVEGLGQAAGVLGRADLASAAQWLIANPPPSTPEVICHGDLHPFNLLIDPAGAITVLDWSGGLIGPAAYDVAFTTLILAEPPVVVPGALRPLVRAAGRLLARRFQRTYARRVGTGLDAESLRWHEGVICLRALVEVAGWIAAGRLDVHVGHPWLISGPAFAARLSRLTSIQVTPR